MARTPVAPRPERDPALTTPVIGAASRSPTDDKIGAVLRLIASRGVDDPAAGRSGVAAVDEDGPYRKGGDRVGAEHHEPHPG
jgi:hypothetical protein